MKFINTYFIGSYKAEYKITELVDIGGMSKIYRAVCNKNSNTVVIKILNFKKTESPLEIKKKLAFEAQISARLNHPGICSILDFACDDDGNYGLVFENLSGNNLENILKKLKKPFSLNESLTIILEVAEALKYAHDPNDSQLKKIIHRDIKPSNIFITDDLNIKLLDFGISTYIDKEFHKNGINEGFTKSYTPPDLWINETKYNLDDYNETHDIYCLGLIFYELLTKRKAFETIHENKNGIINCLSNFGYKDQTLIELFSKWTSKNPKERFQNVQELIESLSFLEKSNNKIDSTEVIQQSIDYTEIDKTLFQSNDHNNGIIEDLAILNILNAINTKMDSLIVKSEIENKTSILSRKTNQGILFSSNINYSEFSTKVLKALNNNIVFFKHNEKSLDDTIAVYSKYLTKNERYSVYSSIYKTLQKTNDLSVYKYLHTIRKLLSLDPYICDEEKNCEGFLESLAGVIYARLNSNQNARININNKIRFYKLRNEKFYINALKFYSLYEDKIISKASEVDKQVISYNLSRFAFADQKIDSIEKNYINELNKRLKLQSLNFDLIINEDKLKLFVSLNEGLRTFALCHIFTLLIKKSTINPKEMDTLNEIFILYSGAIADADLSFEASSLFAELVLEYWNQIKENNDLIKMITTIIRHHISDFGKLLSGLNQNRCIFLNKEEKTDEELVEIKKYLERDLESVYDIDMKLNWDFDPESEVDQLYLEYLEELGFGNPYKEKLKIEKESKINRIFIPIKNSNFQLNIFYLYHREKYCFIKENNLSRYISSLTKLENIKPNNCKLNWKIPYFVYKYGLKDSYTLNTLEFNKILKNLNIDDQDLKFAKRMILCNYNKDVK